MDPEGQGMSTATPQPILEARNLVKIFGSVVALDGADFDLYPGEIVGVIGDNGAGKSTLIKCLAGAIQADEGEVLLDGEPVTFKDPLDARDQGIETVHQTLAVAPSLDIADNLYLGRERRRDNVLGRFLRVLDKSGMERDAKRHMSELGILTVQDMGQAASARLLRSRVQQCSAAG
jgi:fructose transport system ATP-binding protein